MPFGILGGIEFGRRHLSLHRKKIHSFQGLFADDFSFPRWDILLYIYKYNIYYLYFFSFLEGKT